MTATCYPQWGCCRKGDPFQGPKLSSCLTHVLTKKEILLGKSTQVEGSRVRDPRRTALPHGLESYVLFGFMVMGLVSRLPLANHYDSACQPSLSVRGVLKASIVEHIGQYWLPYLFQFSSVQSLSRVQLFATP